MACCWHVCHYPYHWHPDPQSSSSTFPIPGPIPSEKANQAAAAAIDSLNMPFLGPHLFPRAPSASTLHPRLPAKRARTNVFSLLKSMQHAEEPENMQSAKAALNLASLLSYKFFPELSASFEDPALAFQRGAFKAIRAEQMDLPTARPPPDPDKSSFWIRRLPAHVKPLFDENTSPFQNSIQEYFHNVKKSKTLPPSHLYDSQAKYLALLDKAEHAGMLHWSVESHVDGECSEFSNDIKMTLFSVSKSHSRSRLNSWKRV